MKRISITVLATSLLMPLFHSCTDSGSRIAQLEMERDSISAAAALAQQEHDQLFQYISGIENALDSIETEEVALFEWKNGDGVILTKSELSTRVINLGNLLQRQRNYINSLEDSLKNAQGSRAHLLPIITALKQQLESKDKELAQLRSDLLNERQSLASLQQSYGALERKNTQLGQRNIQLGHQNVQLGQQKEQLEQALATQNTAVNTGYVLTATKKDLEKMDILTGGGFLKKKKINYSAFDTEYFRAVDIRTFKTLTISSKKAKLLTPAPSGSYKLEKGANNVWVLTIISPADFWNVSNFLVIQTD